MYQFCNLLLFLPQKQNNKEIMGKYFIRPGVGKMASLYTRVSRTHPKINILLNVGISVERESWERANRSADSLMRFYKTRQGQLLREKLDQIDSALAELQRNYVTDTKAYSETVRDIVNSEARELLQRQKEEEEKAQRQKEEEEKRDVLRFLDTFVSGIKDGTIKNKGTDYARNTCKVWGTFQKVMTRFHRMHPFTWEDINRQLVDDFISFLEDYGYMVKTINKHILCFRAMVRYAFDMQYHDNASIEKFFNKKRVLETDKAREIYLTSEEIQALYDMKLVGLYDVVRDIFLMGCYTCQRFSDYSNLNRSNFTTTPKGTRVVRITQIKTKNTVVIPVLNNNLMTIAEKYDYDTPVITDVILNRYIKKILKDLSKTVPSLSKMEETVLTMKEIKAEDEGKVSWARNERGIPVKARYDLVSSHTARRSGITNLYLSGKFDIFQMMSISGHKDQKTFLDYIKLSSEELADKIASIQEESIQASNAALF